MPSRAIRVVANGKISVPCDLTYVLNLKQRNKHTHEKTKKQAQRYKEQIGSCQRQGWRVGKMGEGGQKVQTYSYKINKP